MWPQYTPQPQYQQQAQYQPQAWTPQQVQPVPQQQQAPQQQQTNMQWVQVNGAQGIRELSVAPNTAVWAMDTTRQVFYHKSADMMGICTAKAYEFSEIDVNAQTAIETGLEARVSRLEAALNEFSASSNSGRTASTSKRKSNAVDTSVNATATADGTGD